MTIHGSLFQEFREKDSAGPLLAAEQEAAARRHAVRRGVGPDRLDGGLPGGRALREQGLRRPGQDAQGGDDGRGRQDDAVLGQRRAVRRGRGLRDPGDVPRERRHLGQRCQRPGLLQLDPVGHPPHPGPRRHDDRRALQRRPARHRLRRRDDEGRPGRARRRLVPDLRRRPGRGAVDRRRDDGHPRRHRRPRLDDARRHGRAAADGLRRPGLRARPAERVGAAGRPASPRPPAGCSASSSSRRCGAAGDEPRRGARTAYARIGP